MVSWPTGEETFTLAHSCGPQPTAAGQPRRQGKQSFLTHSGEQSAQARCLRTGTVRDGHPGSGAPHGHPRAQDGLAERLQRALHGLSACLCQADHRFGLRRPPSSRSARWPCPLRLQGVRSCLIRSRSCPQAFELTCAQTDTRV